MILIGIAGKMASGKDTFADILMRFHFIQRRFALADEVKRIAEDLFQINSYQRTPATRKLLQSLGNGMREISQTCFGHKDIWINLLSRKFVFHSSRDEDIPVYAITDIRYKNEAEWLLNQGHVVIFMHCNDEIRWKRANERSGLALDRAKWNESQRHPSERESDSIVIMEGVHVFDNNRNFHTYDLQGEIINWIRDRPELRRLLIRESQDLE